MQHRAYEQQISEKYERSLNLVLHQVPNCLGHGLLVYLANVYVTPVATDHEIPCGVPRKGRCVQSAEAARIEGMQ